MYFFVVQDLNDPREYLLLTVSIKSRLHVPQIIESAPISIASNMNLNASVFDFADCIGIAKLMKVLGAASLNCLAISGRSGLYLIFIVSIPACSAASALNEKRKCFVVVFTF